MEGMARDHEKMRTREAVEKCLIIVLRCHVAHLDGGDGAVDVGQLAVMRELLAPHVQLRVCVCVRACVCVLA